MARRGRFGRATSGSANLSSFISGLIQNSIQRNESALLNAFNDQTMFGGSVPNAMDIEDYVNSRTQGLDPNSAEYAYYQNMLENARRADRQRQVDSAVTQYNASGGESYDSFYSQISGMLNDGGLSPEEKANLEALLTQKTVDYVGIVASEYSAGITSFDELISKTDVAIGRLSGKNQENALLTRAGRIVARETESLESGMIGLDEFRNFANVAMRGVPEDSAAAYDIKVGIQAAIWNKEVDDYNVALSKAANKGYGAKVKANQNYIDWAKGKLKELEEAGLSESQFYDDIQVEIQKKRTDLNAAKVAGFKAGYTNREKEIQSIESSINELMRNVPLVIGGETKTFSIDQIYGTSVTDAIGTAVQLIRYLDANPDLRSNYESLMEAYRGASADLYKYASANGAASEAKFYKDRSKQLRSMTGLDTAMEDYEDARDIRLDLVSKANGNDASVQLINEQWADFLAGKNTRYFGKGIATPTDAFTEQLISNERALYEGYKTGVPVTGIGATLAGYFERDTPLPAGFSTFEDAEAKNVIDTLNNSKGLSDGTMMLGPDPAQNGAQATIPTRPANQSIGEFTFLTKDDTGGIRATIVQGVPVVGVARGSAIDTWGFYYPDQNLWVDKENGDIYSNPPFEVANGGKIEIDSEGNPRVRVDQDEEVFKTVVSQRTFEPKNAKEGTVVSYADAILGKTSMSTKDARGSVVSVTAGFGPTGIIGSGALQALINTLPEDKVKEVTDAVNLYRQGNELWKQFRAGERNMDLADQSVSVKAFDTFLGQNSEFENKQYRKEVLVIRNGKPEWRSIPYRDAYVQREPGLFVRRDEATEVTSFGKKMDETSQTFPAVIDVRNSMDDPKVKPFVGSIVSPKITTATKAEPSVDYFFRKVGSRGYAGDTVSEGRAVMLAAQAAGAATSGMPRPSLPGYANPNFGTVSTGSSFASPLTFAVPKFTAPTMPVVSAARQAGLGVSAGDTQAELLGQLKALNVPGFSTPNVSSATPSARVGSTSSGPRVTGI